MLTYEIEHLTYYLSTVQCVRDGYEILADMQIECDDANEFEESLDAFKEYCESLYE